MYVVIFFAIFEIAYELIGNMECGDGYQIELDKTHSDPFKCSALVIADKSCGEYFEVRRDKNMCRCTKAEKNKDCKKRSDKNTVLYRIDRSKNQKLNFMVLHQNIEYNIFRKGFL